MGTRNHLITNRQLSRDMSDKGFSSQEDDAGGAGDTVRESWWNQESEEVVQHSQVLKRLKTESVSETQSDHLVAKSEPISLITPEMPSQHSSNICEEVVQHSQVSKRLKTESVSETLSDHLVAKSEPISLITPEMPSQHSSNGGMQYAAKFNNTEKVWQYQDPGGNILGPFSMAQLQDWNDAGHFPVDMRIWRTTENLDDSILLTDALTGRIHKDHLLVYNSSQETQSVYCLHMSSSCSGNAGESLDSVSEISNPTDMGFDRNESATCECEKCRGLKEHYYLLKEENRKLKEKEEALIRENQRLTKILDYKDIIEKNDAFLLRESNRWEEERQTIRCRIKKLAEETEWRIECCKDLSLLIEETRNCKKDLQKLDKWMKFLKCVMSLQQYMIKCNREAWREHVAWRNGERLAIEEQS